MPVGDAPVPPPTSGVMARPPRPERSDDIELALDRPDDAAQFGRDLRIRMAFHPQDGHLAKHRIRERVELPDRLLGDHGDELGGRLGADELGQDVAVDRLGARRRRGLVDDLAAPRFCLDSDRTRATTLRAVITTRSRQSSSRPRTSGS